MKFPPATLRKEYLVKAKLLFALRCLPECLESAAGPDAETAAYLQTLLNLQCSIYELDEYGESNWNIDPRELDQIWQGIRHSWSVVPTKGSSRPSLAEIQNYQRIELNMREGRRPDMMPIEVFYECKTCDVRLMRQLIWNAYEKPDALTRRLWEVFDLSGEVLDDLSDVSEDHLTYNGNRFAFCMRQHGAQRTIRLYELFIAQLSNEFQRIVSEYPDRGSLVSLLNREFATLRAELSARLRDFRREIGSSIQEMKRQRKMSWAFGISATGPFPGPTS